MDPIVNKESAKQVQVQVTTVQQEEQTSGCREYNDIGLFIILFLLSMAGTSTW